MEQTIDSIPSLDDAYLKVVKPQSYFRYWLKAMTNTNERYYVVSANVTFFKDGAQTHSIENHEELRMQDTHDPAYNMEERMKFGPDFSSVEVDSITVAVEAYPINDPSDNSHSDPLHLMLGPFEYVVDMPYYAGCYSTLSDLSSAAKINEDPEVLTPAWCITKCLETGATKRFAMTTKGNECYCYDNVPYQSLQSVPDQNDTLVCSNYCKGGTEYMCGGPSAVSIYVASKLLSLVIAMPQRH